MSMPGTIEMLSPLDAGENRTGSASRIYSELYVAILDHRLPPGTKLAEDALGEVFGVSRTIVRKALQQLAHEGVVEMRPNRGARVARPTVEEARDIFATRRILEHAVLEALVERIEESHIAKLRELVRRERAAYRDGDRQTWIRLSGEFHLRLAEIAGNAVVTDFLRELVSRTSLIIALYERPGTAACSFDEHDALIDALVDKDLAEADSLMKAHLQVCEDKLNLDDAAAAPSLADIFGRAEDE